MRGLFSAPPPAVQCQWRPISQDISGCRNIVAIKEEPLLPHGYGARYRWAGAAAAAILAVSSCAMLAAAARGFTHSWLYQRAQQDATSLAPGELAQFAQRHYSKVTALQCGRITNHSAYDFDPATDILWDHAESPEFCCAVCQWTKACKAWTWIAYSLPRGPPLWGQPGQCWMKATDSGKSQQYGALTGEAPSRPDPQDGQLVDIGPTDSGSIFCFSLAQVNSSELELLQWQHKNKAGIFRCDEQAVYSNVTLNVAPTVRTFPVETDFAAYDLDNYTLANEWFFIAAWRGVITHNRWAFHNWTVKVDPTAAFLPGRLRRILREHSSVAWMDHCRKTLHGPVTVLSRNTVAAFAEDYARSWDGKAPSRCVAALQLGRYSEKLFMDECLTHVLGVGKYKEVGELSCEAGCDCSAWMWCSDPKRVSFHKFNTVESYAQCTANALTIQAAASSMAG